LAQAKKLTLFAAGAASQKYMQGLADQQEVMGAIADCVIEVYAMESCILRAAKLAANGDPSADGAIATTQYYAAKAMQTVELSSRKVIATVAEGDMFRTQLAILRKLAKYDPADTVALGRIIAGRVIEAGCYTL
jgi:butyryl-CoA dehydrogenase